MQREERTVITGDLRAESNGRKVTGHAALFNTRSTDPGLGFVEQISPGAFRSALQKNSVILNFNHDNNIILGRSDAGTLRVAEDERGLSFEADLADTQLIRDMVISPMQRGELRNTSFAFFVKAGGQSWSMEAGGTRLRTISEMDRIYDVSLVARAGYDQASASLRGIATPGDILRQAGVADGEVSDLEWRKLQLDAMGANFALRAKPKTLDQFVMLQHQIRKVQLLQL